MDSSPEIQETTSKTPKQEVIHLKKEKVNFMSINQEKQYLQILTINK